MSKTKETVRSPQHQGLIDREKQIAEDAVLEGQNPADAINADRRLRWKALLAGREESSEIREWAARMTRRFGPQVFVWHNALDWITALYVTRYGEAEDFWPAAFTADDALRAQRWYRGDTPNGVRYIDPDQPVSGRS